MKTPAFVFLLKAHIQPPGTARIEDVVGINYTILQAQGSEYPAVVGCARTLMVWKQKTGQE